MSFDQILDSIPAACLDGNLDPSDVSAALRPEFMRLEKETQTLREALAEEKFNLTKAPVLDGELLTIDVWRNETPGAENPIEMTLMDQSDDYHKPCCLRVCMTYAEAERLAAKLFRMSKVIAWSQRGAVTQMEVENGRASVPVEPVKL